MSPFILVRAMLSILVGGQAMTSGDVITVDQEGKPSGFTDTIKRLSEARNRIRSYDVTVGPALKRLLLLVSSIEPDIPNLSL